MTTNQLKLGGKKLKWQSKYQNYLTNMSASAFHGVSKKTSVGKGSTSGVIIQVIVSLRACAWKYSSAVLPSQRCCSHYGPLDGGLPHIISQNTTTVQKQSMAFLRGEITGSGGGKSVMMHISGNLTNMHTQGQRESLR